MMPAICSVMASGGAGTDRYFLHPGDKSRRVHLNDLAARSDPLEDKRAVGRRSCGARTPGGRTREVTVALTTTPPADRRPGRSATASAHGQGEDTRRCGHTTTTTRRKTMESSP
jgi:hypothetical protein